MQLSTALKVGGFAALALGAAGGGYWLARRDDPPKEGPTPGIPTHPWTHGNRAELLIDYDEFLPPLLADLRAAQDVINIVEYNWEPSGPSIEIASILKQQAAAGVEVNVMTDKRGSFGIDSTADPADTQAYFDDLERHGVNVIVTDPHGDKNPIGLDLDHRKMFDIDHRITYVGGLGLASTPDGKYDDWHDLMFRLEGPVSAQTGAEFIQHWANQGGVVSSRQYEAFANATPVGTADAVASARMLPNTPGVGLDATEDFFDAAAEAGDRLWAMTPYVGDRQAQEALIAAAQAGKDVRVLVPSPESNNNGPLLKVSRTFYRQMIAAGVRVYEYPTMMHAKAWITDDAVTVGSTNLSDGALDEYLEMSAVVRDDPATLAKAEAMFEDDIAISAELGIDEFGTVDRVAEIARRATQLEF